MNCELFDSLRNGEGDKKMALRINNNVASVFAQKHLSRSQERLSSNFEHLSSGLRITKAADDAAGLAVSEAMRGQIMSLKQAMLNTNDGISLVQTAESSLAEIASSLMRMRQLAVQSANGVLQTQERGYINTEFAALKTEIDRIANVTEFNGVFLTNGVTTNVVVQVGIKNNSSNDQITVGLQDANIAQLALTSNVVNTEAAARTAIDALDIALDTINTSRADYGAAQNSLSSALHNLESYTENLVAAESRIRDVDFAAETADLTRNSIFQQAGVAILAQANQAPQAALQLLQ
jgi:flagellin